MGKVTTGATMSLDGFIAGPDDSGFGIELVPVVLGSGTPLFAGLGATPTQFDGPIAVVEG